MNVHDNLKAYTKYMIAGCVHVNIELVNFVHLSYQIQFVTKKIMTEDR